MLGSDIVVCTDGAASTLGYFDFSLAPTLLNYSYTSIALISILLGIYVLFNTKTLLSKIFFLQTLTFTLFICSEIFQWVVIPAGSMHFAYSLSLLLQALILFFTFYFVYVFVKKRDLTFNLKLFIAILILPVIVFLPSHLNIEGVVFDSCTGVTGFLWEYYYALEVLVATFFLLWSIFNFKIYKSTADKHILASAYLLLASSFFLFIFFVSYFYADITGLYEFNLMGPLGKLIFLGVLFYLIVRFKTFSIELLGVQALMVALVILVASQYFFVDSQSGFILTGITLMITLGFGYLLVRSVKREVNLRHQIEGLVVDLEKANERLKILDKMKSEFVSIASHQLRSPLTSIRGYSSMLAEGSYGKLPKKVTEILVKIAESSKYMALSVEDYLNVSRIEAGNMKYEMSDFSLKEITEKIVDEFRPIAIKKGIVMIFRSDCSGSCSVHADIGKTRQVIMNLLDNSMKYTPKGTITVVSHDDIKKKKMYVTIQDTGVGMSQQTLDEVFDKFVRAKNANNVNVTGTGLGLFVAKKMITDMNGRVWAESEGEGKGSTFHIELPLLNVKKSHNVKVPPYRSCTPLAEIARGLAK